MARKIRFELTCARRISVCLGSGARGVPISGRGASALTIARNARLFACGNRNRTRPTASSNLVARRRWSQHRPASTRRFVSNWKRESPIDGVYPSYDTVVVDFERLWGEFRSFVSQEQLGGLLPRQLELSYINIIPRDCIPNGDPVLVDHERDVSRPRFLPDPESSTWRTSYLLPDNSGRLHVLATTARQISTGAPLIRLEISARGINDVAADDMRAWFDLAHEWVTNGFVDVTTTRIQSEVWRRQS
jgi:hypothetical protein